MIEAGTTIAPWLVDGRNDLWVRPCVFARVINRSRRRVFQMLADGSVEKFGYKTYRDPIGAWFIRISEIEYRLVKQAMPSAQRG